ncbi:hypothetical protein [Empedobacter brevis]|uniref:hypothetical protein n=1 Tax=Empedobacter brevis TaxID=247 RepID=UPI00289B8C74|nr:hypothetical protein [Empedobacter brevis]
MQQDYIKREIEILGKVLAFILSKFFGKNGDINFVDLENEIQTNENLSNLYNTTNIKNFKQLLKELNIDMNTRINLILFFFNMYKHNPENKINKEKCLILLDKLDTVTFEMIQILSELKK